MPLGDKFCAKCVPGTYSLGGGRTVEDWCVYIFHMIISCNKFTPYDFIRDEWPTELGIFSTYCVNNLPNPPAANCSGWTLTGATVRSGKIADVESSILTLQTQV